MSKTRQFYVQTKHHVRANFIFTFYSIIGKITKTLVVNKTKKYEIKFENDDIQLWDAFDINKLALSVNQVVLENYYNLHNYGEECKLMNEKRRKWEAGEENDEDYDDNGNALWKIIDHRTDHDDNNQENMLWLENDEGNIVEGR